jgi:hypothetical protein
VEDETTVRQEAAQPGRSSRLSSLVQLTGYNDVVYSEAFLTIDRCELTIDIHIINRRNKPLVAAAFDFISTAQHKILEKTPAQVLKPLATATAKVVIKF